MLRQTVICFGLSFRDLKTKFIRRIVENNLLEARYCLMELPYYYKQTYKIWIQISHQKFKLILKDKKVDFPKDRVFQSIHK
jgi:hypothetical protein